MKKVAALLALSLALPVLAGPPLLCHPYGPVLKEALPPQIDGILARLMAEPETLVRLEILRNVVNNGDCKGGTRRAVLGMLEKVSSKASEKHRNFDVANGGKVPPDTAEKIRAELLVARHRAAFEVLAAKVIFRGNDPEKQVLNELRKSVVEDVSSDPAAWYLLARAVTPLMRTGTLEEHAQAFVKAHELTQALPEGDVRAHLEMALAQDLEVLERHVVDGRLKEPKRAPSSAERLAILKELSLEKKG